MTPNAPKSIATAIIDQDVRDLLLDVLATLEAIVEEGLTFATEQGAERVIARIKARFMNRAEQGLKLPTETLTRRETEVMTLTALGKTRGEISRILSLSEETVKDYTMRSCRKLHAVNKTHAVALAVALRLISPCMQGSPKETRK